MSTAAKTRTLLPAAERLDSIERAAARAFCRTGFAGTSMADVAAEAGVTKVLVYRHVDSKNGLYRSVLARVSTTLREEFAAALRGDVPDPATVAHLATARRDPDGYRLLFRHAQHEPEFAEYAAGVNAVIVGVADRAFGADVAPHLRRWAVEVTFRWLVQAVLAWLDHGRADHDAEFVAHTTAGLAALIVDLTGVHLAAVEPQTPQAQEDAVS